MSKHDTVSQDSGAEELSPDGFKARAERKPPVDGFHQGEEQFRLLVEATTEYAIFVLDPEGFIESWNAGAERIKGYTVEEILGRHFSVFYPEERVQEGVPERALKAAARDGVWTDEGWRLRKDGTRFWADVTITALEDDEGGLRGFAKVTRDLTERKRAQEALQESEEKFRELAENALIGIGLLQDGIYKYVNPALARIAGYTPEELIGESPEVFFHPDDWPAIRERVRRRIEGKAQEAHYQARVQAKDGQIRRVEVLGRRITYQGKPAIIGTVLDITERRRLQREVLRAQEEERRRLGQDLHDGVASQLTGVAISLGLLARRMEDDDLTSRVEEVQALVQESCDNVRRLSHGLSPAGIAESGLSGALERLSENVEEGRFESDGELPELQEDEAAHLYWIAQEAVTNARKYAEAKQIVIRLACGGDALVLEVEDDGKGFVPGEVEQGGLGLRSMRYRADLLGAAFTIDSDSGEGTRVVCRLSL